MARSRIFGHSVAHVEITPPCYVIIGQDTSIEVYQTDDEVDRAVIGYNEAEIDCSVLYLTIEGGKE